MRQKRRAARSTQPPTGGMGQRKAWAARVLAFSPVVTRAWQWGMRASRAGMSVCNKQTFFVLFFVKLFVHFAGRFRGSFVPVYC